VLCILFCLPSSCVLCMVAANTYCVVHFVLFAFVLCLVHGGVQHILCCALYFACLRLLSCVWWRPTHIVLCILFCLPSSCVLCMVASNIYCAVDFVLFVFVLCLVYLMVQVSLDCPFMIALRFLYSSVYSRPS
jgi:hypothetical protein